MTDVVAAPTQASSQRLIEQVNRLKTTLARDSIHVTDMSRAGTLETGIGAEATGDETETPRAGPVGIARLEGPIVARPIATAAPGESRFRFFLDGSQKTIPAFRVGLTPVVAAISAAGILERDNRGQPRLRSDSLRVNQAWIAPKATGDSSLNHVINEFMDAGLDVRDPFEDRFGNSLENYDTLIGDYGRTLSLAFDLAGRLRAEQEILLSDHWRDTISAAHPDQWIVIDGPLRGNLPNAVGLVKNLQTQQLTSREAVALFDLPQGSRTTAFRYAANTADANPATSTQGKTMWYMRLWNAVGMDARHSLVRIEAAHDVSTPEQIDEISAWIMAERLPRATEDPRWPTLLYPIYYLERILKRRLAEITLGWPSA